jgi:ubiquinone/menaquinone biosynthesis C-methylase UbiE
MNTAVQLRVQRYGWDLAEPHYERYWARQLVPAQRRLLERAAVRPGERVLDVACGTGSVTLPAAWGAGPQGHVLATDISEAMVRRTAEEAWREGISWIETRRAHAEESSGSDGTFDVALCSLGLMYVPDPVRALAAMRRALRPGGRALVAVWGHRAHCGWAEIFPIVDRRVRSDVCPLFFQLGTGEALADAFALAGFETVESERIRTTLRYRSARAAVGAAFEGGPVALAHSRFDAATRTAAHAEYLAAIAPYRRKAGYAIPGEFVIARGVAPAARAPVTPFIGVSTGDQEAARVLSPSWQCV